MDFDHYLGAEEINITSRITTFEDPESSSGKVSMCIYKMALCFYVQILCFGPKSLIQKTKCTESLTLLCHVTFRRMCVNNSLLIVVLCGVHTVRRPKQHFWFFLGEVPNITSYTPLECPCHTSAIDHLLTVKVTAHSSFHT